MSEQTPPSAPERNMRQLNDELLKVEKADDEPSKRNTKEWLMSKILQLADDNGLELSCSNTKLKRMNKKELNQLLGALMEEVSKQQMARSVGSKSTDEKSIALGTLRMVHDMMAMATERGLNGVLPSYGYGFTESLKNPTVSQCVDDCLQEIADSTDVLQYIESPFARLGIAWAGAMATSIRPAQKTLVNSKNVRATKLGPSAVNRAQTVQHRPSRRPEAGQKHRPTGSNPPHVERV